MGPRAARVHVGGGRTGVSTGVGPVSLYASMGGGRRSGGRTAGQAANAARNRQLAAAYARQTLAQQQEAYGEALARTFHSILHLHRQEFAPAKRPIAPPPAPINRAEIYASHKKQALKGVGLFARELRRSRLDEARAAAQGEIDALVQRTAEEQDSWQRYLDARWTQLLANEPMVVISTLEEAFEDNQAAAAAVGVNGDEVAIVMLAPNLDAVPESMPERTAAGNMVIRTLSKTHRNDYYNLLVFGHVLATVREAFAVAPAIDAARIVVVRSLRPDAYGKRRVECILAVRFTRDAFIGIQWQDADASQIVTDASTELLINQGPQIHDLRRIDLENEPDLVAFLAHVDLSEVVRD